jgi:hypothetical protein
MSESHTAPSLEDWMRRNYKMLAYGALALSVCCLVAPIMQFVANYNDQGPNVLVGIWGGCLSFIFCAAAIFLLLSDPSVIQGEYRLLLMGVGGAVGLMTFLLGVLLPLGDWNQYFVPGLLAEENAVPIIRLWRENLGRLGVCLLCVVGGLVLMFVSLLPARGVERVSPTQRRLLYGYNAALTGILLVSILGLVNLLAYVPMAPFDLLDKQIDWTPSQIHTLSEASGNLLKSDVSGSIDILALIRQETPYAEDIRTLVANCRRYKKDVGLKFVSQQADPTEYEMAWQKYRRNFTAPVPREYVEAGMVGIVVIYRSAGGKEDATGIPFEELFAPPEQRPGEQARPSRYVFRGENQLMRVIKKLSEKTPAKIYFTQGHGELSLGEPGQDPQGAVSVLKKKMLDKGYYEIEPIELGPTGVAGGKKLSDADVVVVARPRFPFSEPSVRALEEYMNPKGAAKKGHLILALGTESRDGKMAPTGLEALLRRNGVEISSTRLLARLATPEGIPTIASPRSENQLAKAFGGNELTVVMFQSPRKVEPLPPGKDTAGLKVEPVLITLPAVQVWEESNLAANGFGLLQLYTKQDAVQEFRKRLTRGVSVAVAVSESRNQGGMPAGHVPVGEDVPRMVVLGDASWMSDQTVMNPRGLGADNSVDLMISSIQWLRGKSDLGKRIAEDKERPMYSLAEKKLGESGKLKALIWLPLGLIFLSIVALGGGVWVVRRR